MQNQLRRNAEKFTNYLTTPMALDPGDTRRFEAPNAAIESSLPNFRDAYIERVSNDMILIQCALGAIFVAQNSMVVES
jgi:hypothetical protein